MTILSLDLCINESNKYFRMPAKKTKPSRRKYFFFFFVNRPMLSILATVCVPKTLGVRRLDPGAEEV